VNAGSKSAGGAVAGRVAAALAAVGFSSSAVVAPFAYEAGSTPMTIIALRLVPIALAMVLLLRGRLLARLSARQAVALVAAGLGLFLAGFGSLSAAARLPVSLAVLILYTFPLMVAAAVPFVERRSLTRGEILAFPLAFAGLALALGPDLSGLDLLGLLGALLAAAAIAVLIIVSGPLSRSLPSGVPLGLTVLVALVPAFGVLSLTGGPAWPGPPAGWAGVLGSGLAYLAALALQFRAIRLVGPAATALLLNCEPLVTFVLAALLLGERLGPSQLFGGVLVLAAVLATSWRTRRKG